MNVGGNCLKSFIRSPFMLLIMDSWILFITIFRHRLLKNASSHNPFPAAPLQGGSFMVSLKFWSYSYAYLISWNEPSFFHGEVIIEATSRMRKALVSFFPFVLFSYCCRKSRALILTSSWLMWDPSQFFLWKKVFGKTNLRKKFTQKISGWNWLKKIEIFLSEWVKVGWD